MTDTSDEPTDSTAQAVEGLPTATGSPAPRGASGRRVARTTATILLAGATAGLLAFLAARLAGLDTHTPMAQLVAYTPYVTVAALVVAVVAAALRRRRLMTVAALVVAVYATLLVPRVMADNPTPAAATSTSAGTGLTVMTANVWYGSADVGALVALVRRERPDVLSVQELTAEAVTRLDAAGLAELLPHRALRPMPGTQGTGLYARTPLTDTGQLPGTYFTQVRARTVHKGVTLDLVAVHPQPPMPWNTRLWRHEMAQLPRADRGDGAVTVLAGDFNATLDHSLLRTLIATGYTDAAAAAGAGLVPTWSSLDRGGLPVTIDHVLVEGGRASAVRVYDVPGSDHRAVVANLVV